MIKINIAANFGGSIWAALMSFLFIPLYIHFIGIEAYGLIGFFSTLIALFGLLDMGISSALNREIARLSVHKEDAKNMRDLVRTLEIPYWIIGLIIAVAVILLSPIIASKWLNIQNLSIKTVRYAIMIMGLAVAFQWPISFYSGGLMGLQKQVLLNLINVVISTFRGVGAVLILWVVSPTVIAFFLWQIIVSALNTGLLLFFLKKNLPKGDGSPQYRAELLKSVWRFAADMTGIAAISTILVQLDKVILSKILSLEIYGYYSLASLVAMSIYRFVSPVFNAIYPKFTTLVASESIKEIIVLYHKSSQLVTVLVMPIAIMLSLFSKEILLLWTQSVITADNTYLLVSILVAGTALHAIMYVPYALQLAYGWTRLALVFNSILVIIQIPLMFILTNKYGGIGAACVWVILNIVYLIINIPLMHRKIMPAEKMKWYFDDLLYPFIAALFIALLGRLIIKSYWSPLLLIGSILFLSLCTLIAAALSANKLFLSFKIQEFIDFKIKNNKRI